MYTYVYIFFFKAFRLVWIDELRPHCTSYDTADNRHWPVEQPPRWNKCFERKYIISHSVNNKSKKKENINNNFRK